MVSSPRLVMRMATADEPVRLSALIEKQKGSARPLSPLPTYWYSVLVLLLLSPQDQTSLFVFVANGV